MESIQLPFVPQLLVGVVEYVFAMTSPTTAVKTTFRVVALLLGFLQAWAYRFYIEPDGINYLDIADAYLRRDWGSALNGYWSPLYSWLLAGVKWLFAPSAYWESTALHLLNFFLFLLALFCFEFFFRKLLALLAARFPDAVGEQGLPNWAWWTLGYVAFLLLSLRLISLNNDTPDMALAALLFLSTALVIEIAQRPSTLSHAMLGAVLAVAYLAKSVMLPLSFLYLATAALVSGRGRKPDPRAALGLAAFFLVSSPFVIPLSRAKGHFTFGETGRMAYLAQVTLPAVSDASSAVGPLHPIKRLFENPAVYTYSAPFASTYPPWHDASYWWEGVSLRFSLRDQLRVITRSAASYFHILSVEKEWIAGWLVLAIVAGDWRAHAKRWLALWFIWLPSMAMLALYALVLVEPRYVAVAMAIVWLSLFAALPWHKINGVPGLGAATVLAITIISGVSLLREEAPNLTALLKPPAHTQWMAAMQLRQLGLQPGHRVAVLGHTTVADYWAHLGGFTIVADVPLEEVPSYSSATPEKRSEISSTLAGLGAKAIVSASFPGIPNGWQPLGDSGYYVSILRAPSYEERR